MSHANLAKLGTEKTLSMPNTSVILLTPDQTYQVLQLSLYILAFFILVLIFLYIAYERPGEGREKDREHEKNSTPIRHLSSPRAIFSSREESVASFITAQSVLTSLPLPVLTRLQNV